jgi:hypothetical protein
MALVGILIGAGMKMVRGQEMGFAYRIVWSMRLAKVCVEIVIGTKQVLIVLVVVRSHRILSFHQMIKNLLQDFVRKRLFSQSITCGGEGLSNVTMDNHRPMIMFVQCGRG